MVGKYYNKITNKYTEFEYRFKTEEEFQKEFGDYWRSEVDNTFVEGMNYLLGMDYPHHIKKVVLLYCVDCWSISMDMLTKNDTINIKNYFKNNNVYENNNKKYYNNITNKYTEFEYRIKTEEEFKEEFGINWRKVVSGSFVDDMDYILGTDYPYHIDEYNSVSAYGNYLDKGYDTWTISMDMITKNDSINIKNYFKNNNIYEKLDNSKEHYNKITKEKTEFEYRFKTEEEFQNEFGYNWGDVVKGSFVESMKYLLGKDYPHIIVDEELLYRVDGWYISMDMLTKNNIINIKNYFKNNNIYETINNKPDFFNSTHYRLPNEDELKNIDECNLNASEIINGFRYNIVGKGILRTNEKNMIIQSIKMLININENNIEYKIALEKVEKLKPKN